MAAHPVQHGEARVTGTPAGQSPALYGLVLQPGGVAVHVDQEQVVLVFRAQARAGAEARARRDVEGAEAQPGDAGIRGRNGRRRDRHLPTVTGNAKRPSFD
jgi:hypothetical protein